MTIIPQSLAQTLSDYYRRNTNPESRSTMNVGAVNPERRGMMNVPVVSPEPRDVFESGIAPMRKAQEQRFLSDYASDRLPAPEGFIPSQRYIGAAPEAMTGTSLPMPTSGIPTSRVGQPDVPMGAAHIRLQNLLQSGASKYEGKGFWDRFKQALKGVGLATIASGNPLVGLAGGAITAADPNFYNRMRHRVVDLPNAQREAGIETAAARDQLGITAQQAQIDNLAEDNERARAQMALNQQAHDSAEKLRREQAAALETHRQATVANQEYDDYSRNPANWGKPIPKELADRWGRPYLGGTAVQPPPKPERNVQTQVDGQGRIWERDPQSGQWVPAQTQGGGQLQGKDPDALTPYQRWQVRMDEWRMSRGIHEDSEQARTRFRNEGNAVWGDYQKQMNVARAADNKWSKIREELAAATATNDPKRGSLEMALKDAEDAANEAWAAVRSTTDVLESYGYSVDRTRADRPTASRPKAQARGGQQRGGGKQSASAQTTRREARASLIRDFAGKKFGGDVNAARKWLVDNGYTILEDQ